jgi:FG-GAP-like repeat
LTDLETVKNMAMQMSSITNRSFCASHLLAAVALFGAVASCDGGGDEPLQVSSTPLTVNVVPGYYNEIDIMAALNTLNATSPTGGTIRIPSGVFDFRLAAIWLGNYPDNITIECEGHGTTLRRRVYWDGATWQATRLPMININATKGIRIKNCRFELAIEPAALGTRDEDIYNPTSFIQGEIGVDDFEISGNLFEITGAAPPAQSNVYGVIINGGTNGFIHHNISDGMGFVVQAAGGIDALVENINISDNAIRRPHRFGISLAGNGITNRLRNLTVTRNRIESLLPSAAAIQIGSHQWTDVGEMAFIQVTDNVISGEFKDTSPASNAIMFGQGSDSHDWSIQNNIITNEGAEATWASPFAVQDRHPTPVRRFTFTGNQIGTHSNPGSNGFDGYAVNLRVSLQDFVVSDNIIKGGYGLNLEALAGKSIRSGVISGNIIDSKGHGLVIALEGNGSGVIDDVSISDNHIASSTNAAHAAVYFGNTTSASMVDIKFVDNRLTQGTWAGTVPATVACVRNLPTNCNAVFAFTAPFNGTVFPDTSDFGINDPGYYRTIRFGDIDGDGDMDACGRAMNGIQCAKSTGSLLSPATVWTTDYSNAAGWLPAMYSTTLQLADVNGDLRADICGRGPAGIVCSLANASGTGFGASTAWTTAFNDTTEFDTNESYFGSISYADVNGDGRADVCGRGSTSVQCGLSTGSNTFAANTTWLTTGFRNADGWLPLQYGTTIRLADVNGDGRADMCGRGPLGIVCAVASLTTNAFTTPSVWTTSFADAEGFNSNASYYRTISLRDLNADGKADVCGRHSTGVRCSISGGTNFAPSTLWLSNNMTDAAGWLPLKYGTTVQLADINDDGKADICGRGGDGLSCSFAP